jgi:hypothetical protein
MARTRRTARKSTGQLPIGQLAPRNVPQQQESQPDVQEEASPEEEPFEIELVVPESPTVEDLPTEEQQQPGGMTRNTRPTKITLPRAIPRPRSCTEMLTRWSPSGPKLRSSPAGFGLCWITWASPPLPGTGSRKSHVQGGWSSRSSQRFSLDPESSVDTRDQLSGPLTVMLLLMSPGRPSHRGSIATRVDCRTLSTTSCPTGRKVNSRPTR